MKQMCRGETYQKLKKYEERLKDLDKIINSEMNVTNCYMDELTLHFNNMLNNELNNTYALRSRGETYRLKGKYNEALDDLINY
ncbi:hypothetical protein C2G38_2235335 [Gigaspora rosea]|uniref:Uncharacterized protein n=1 Tax=Gigaspora rosea TaxID=44941 RepID=A0A397TTC5_9GLOM|nr:hypothetical protein C2G38_2235335 [Gigaspora rosea]